MRASIQSETPRRASTGDPKLESADDIRVSVPAGFELEVSWRDELRAIGHVRSIGFDTIFT